MFFGGMESRLSLLSRWIKLKFGGGIIFEMLISYFMSILSNKMNLIKINGSYVGLISFFY